MYFNGVCSVNETQNLTAKTFQHIHKKIINLMYFYK